MSAPKKLPNFPDVEAKLQKPSKQSAFDKQRADADAKRKREAAETAAVYESFVKSFDNEDDDDDEIAAIARGGQGAPFGRGPGRGGFAAPVGAGKRHFGNTGSKSGPGTLGPVLGPPPPSYGRKRGFDGGIQKDYGRRDDGRGGRFGGYDDDKEREREYNAPPKGISKAFGTSDDEGEGRAADRAEERAVAKPTLRLANLPPGTSPAVIKALIPANLTVEKVTILPPGGPGTNERKSMAAIVILSQETPATDIDAAVSSLQNRYLGYGFYLSLHRHLSSAVATAVTASSLATNTASQPFGAKPVAQPNDQNPHQQTQFHRGFAPPTSYGPPGGPINRTLLHVPVQAPRDIKQLQLIHKVVESVLEHGPEFEALLMSRPDVQRDEKWAWIWNARSEGGVWYRWRLWEVITGSQTKDGKQGKYLPLFEGSNAWKMPEKPLLYEYTTNINEFISDSEYNSSDDDDYEDDGQKQGEAGPGVEEGNAYLNPLDKAKLVHLLARLPTTLSRIRKGDIARVTTFAITHASRGADEIVDLIVSNIQKPFTLTSANPEHKLNTKVEDDARTKEGENTDPLTLVADDKPSTNEPVDTSAASLVGLYVVSDMLSSSATSGVRHSWRFRQLFESALRDRKVFDKLGLTAERLGWGRLRADKWKRSIGLVLGLWEGWCVFPAESQDLFVKSFENPPHVAVNKPDAQIEGAGRWKPVEAGDNAGVGKGFKPIADVQQGPGYDPAGGEAMDIDDIDGDVMNEDLEDELMDSDIDGVPMDDDSPPSPSQQDVDDDPTDEDQPHPTSQPPPPPSEGDITKSTAGDTKEGREGPASGAGEKGPRTRMRAVDMFADDDVSE
ncbi:hypothetical protein BJ170DRAFT_666848 [Xylariales sp. AK1849]|nr:hypothetical protein BJ170DRAFT_666848 [Xylariales sp. AK1849]